MNEEFEAEVPEAMPYGKEPMKTMKMKFKANSYSVGTIWMNDEDAIMRNQEWGPGNSGKPPWRYTKGYVFRLRRNSSGVIKLGFATGGRFQPGMGPAYKSRLYTPATMIWWIRNV